MTGRRRRLRGMTLVELVVAMAVLSMVALVLGASLRGLGDSAVRVDARVAAVDDMRVSASFLRELLARVSVASLRAGSLEPGRERLFEAAADHVAWVAVMPARFGASGRYAFRLAAEPVSDQERALVLRFAPLDDQAGVFPDWHRAQTRVLAQGVRQLQVSYGGAGLESGWLQAWTRQDMLPPRLRLDVILEAGTWPPLVLPMRTLAPPRPIFTLGGGG